MRNVRNEPFLNQRGGKQHLGIRRRFVDRRQLGIPEGTSVFARDADSPGPARSETRRAPALLPRKIYFIQKLNVTWETPQRFTDIQVCASRGSGCQLGYLGFSEGAKRVIESTACSGPPSVQGKANAGGGQFDS